MRDSKRQQVVDSARELVRRKVEFLEFGRDPAEGVDCIGFVLAVAIPLGLLPADAKVPAYSFRGLSAAPFAAFDEYMDRVTVPQPGDVVVMPMGRKYPVPRHCLFYDETADGPVVLGMHPLRGIAVAAEVSYAHLPVWAIYSFRYA